MSSEIVIKFLVAAVLAGTPFLFGRLAKILSEKVGHLNLGVRGHDVDWRVRRIHGRLSDG